MMTDYYYYFDLFALARVHAHLCGDGGLYVYKTAEKDRVNRADICYFNTNIELINSFRQDMLKLFKVKMYYVPRKFRINVKSIRIARILLDLSSFSTRSWRIPKIIKAADKEVKLEWIKAFSHDEGYTP